MNEPAEDGFEHQRQVAYRDAELAAHAEDVTTLSAEDVGWMMRSIRDARSRMAEERATHDRYRDKLLVELRMIDEDQERATLEDVDKINYLEAQLRAHLLNKRAADPSVKSIATPWGRVESREQQPEYVKDEAVLLAWCQESVAGFTREKVTYTTDWERLKNACHVNEAGRLVTDYGEVIPGVEVIQRPPKVVVKVVE